MPEKDECLALLDTYFKYLGFVQNLAYWDGSISGEILESFIYDAKELLGVEIPDTSMKSSTVK